eukprot:CAMPEP_0201898322 /NCGR_PEP_ID=MMETSP0902-20130614/48309_1 /ASSEMBLY_ACC=CAM_ASM_000551 /TAXON_ID=420261 /ORGANISM="Thalassiosira antarctica, Strain CCMP982" /LENGTH=32 /DNA_ID= /DNA_START= /DNA_END= /DNA_ORIENTATION=
MICGAAWAAAIAVWKVARRAEVGWGDGGMEVA